MIRFDPRGQGQVPGRRVAAAPPALAGEPDALSVDHPRRDVHLITAAVQRDRTPTAPIGFLDSQLELGLLVGTGNRPESAAATEQIAEEIFDIDAAAAADALTEAHPGTGRRVGTEAAEPRADPLVVILGHPAEVFTESVVAFPGVRGGEYVISLVELLEPILGAWGGVDVGMIFARQRPKRFLDLLVGRIARHPENLVIVTRHGAFTPRGR